MSSGKEKRRVRQVNITTRGDTGPGGSYETGSVWVYRVDRDVGQTLGVDDDVDDGSVGVQRSGGTTRRSLGVDDTTELKRVHSDVTRGYDTVHGHLQVGAGQLYTPEEIPPVPTTYSDTIPELCVVRKMSLY